MKTGSQTIIQKFSSTCIFSTSKEPFHFDSKKLRTKRNGIHFLPRLDRALYWVFCLLQRFLSFLAFLCVKKVRLETVSILYWGLDIDFLPRLGNFGASKTKFRRWFVIIKLYIGISSRIKINLTLLVQKFDFRVFNLSSKKAHNFKKFYKKSLKILFRKC